MASLVDLAQPRQLTTGRVQIWCGDSEQMDWPVDLDLLATDPPFGVPYRSNRTEAAEVIAGDDDQDKVDRILAACWRRLRPHRHAYIFGPPRPLEAAKTPLVWDRRYTATGDLTAIWGPSHLDIWFYAHRYRSEPRAGELSARLRRGSVICEAAPRGRAAKLHPNHKPVRLWQRLIESSTLVGDLVIDPFCGSGSSAVAAALTGRRYVGVELDETYALRAAEWVDRTTHLLGQIGGV